MLKHVMTLGMFSTAGLVFAIGSAAPTTWIGLAVLGCALGFELTAWRRVVHARRGRTARASR